MSLALYPSRVRSNEVLELNGTELKRLGRIRIGRILEVPSEYGPIVAKYGYGVSVAGGIDREELTE